MLLEADPGRRAQRLENMEEAVRALEAPSRASALVTFSSGGKLGFTVRDAAQLDAARGMRPLTKAQGLTGHRDWKIRSQRGSHRPDPDRRSEGRYNSAIVAREVVRRRIDELGPVSRPSSARANAHRRPGARSRGSAALKALLGQTAKLEFKLVDSNADPADVAAGRAPPGSQIVPMPTAPVRSSSSAG